MVCSGHPCPEICLLVGPDAVLVAQFPGDDLLGIGLEERLGLVSGLEVLPHEDPVGANLDEDDVVVGLHGVCRGLPYLHEDPAVDLLDVRDVLVLVGIGGLRLELYHRLSAADGSAVASCRIVLLDDLSALGAFVELDLSCHGCYRDMNHTALF